MTIYRLNRVPDKLHVTLLELLGIQLDGPERRRHRRALPARRAADRAAADRGRRDRGRHAAHRARRRDRLPGRARTSRSPPARPAAYVLQRGGQVKDVGVADGEARPQGADQMPFGNPPAVGDALYVGFDEPIGRLLMQVDVDASPARGAGVNPEDPPLRWEVSQGDNGWEEAVVLEDLTGGFNYGAGTVELQLPPRSAVQPLGGHRMHWLRCRIDDKTRHGGAATTYTQAPEIYSLTAAPIGALLPALHAAQEENEILGVSDGTPGPDVPAALQPGAQARDRRDARGPGPGVGRLGGLGAAARLRHLDGVRPPLHPQPGRRRDRARSGDPRDRRRLDAVRRHPAQGRAACASRATATAAAARGNVAAGSLSDPALARWPASTPSPTRSRPTAASTRRRSSTPASARRWRSAPATARSRPRTSSSWPARRRRASRARSACRRRSRAARSRCTSCRGSTRPTASSPTTSCCPTSRCCRRSPSTSTSAG